MVEEIYFNGLERFKWPSTNLPDLPMRPASTTKMSGVTGYSYDVAFPNAANNVRWWNPLPALAAFNRDSRVLTNCGIDPATISLLANQNTIACAPPRGFGAVAGRRTQYREAATATFTVGPFCIGDFQDQYNAALMMRSYFDAVKDGAGAALKYQQMRMFIAHSHNVVAMRSEGGQFAPNVGVGQFVTVPNTSGTFETLLEAINQAQIPFEGTFEIRMSGQLWEYYVRDYYNRNGINLIGPASALAGDVRSLWNIVGGPSEGWTLMDKRYPQRKFVFMVGFGTYVWFRQIGPNLADWAFQDPYIQYVEEGTGNGVLTRTNPDWGRQCSCPNDDKTLAELLFITQRGSETLIWESFPTRNPGSFDLAGYRASRFRGDSKVETDAERLWNSSTFNIYTGLEVDQYFLDQINADNAANDNPTCYNNRQNTWFAADLTIGGLMVEKRPQASTVIAAAVPAQSLAVSLTCCPVAQPEATEIIATPVEPDPPSPCHAIEAAEAIVLPAGTIFPVGTVSAQALCSGTADSGITIRRLGGSSGTVTVDYTVVDGTAVRTTDFTTSAASGTITFLDGVTEMELDVDIIAWECEEGGETTKEFTVTWENGELDEDAFATTTFTIHCCTPADNTCPDPICPTC